VTPRSGSFSRISRALTSSSRASSLMRILFIDKCYNPCRNAQVCAPTPGGSQSLPPPAAARFPSFL
jgi:hypothetical protein